jgi:putative flippase GtrA
MGPQTFRYAFSGGVNTLLGLAVYFVSFKYILQEKNLDLGFFAFKSHIAALFMSFCISFPFGFFLMKYVVFSDSDLRGKVQLFRYFLVYMINLALNYAFLKVFVELFHIYAVGAQVMTTAIIIVFSYIFQRHFTFRKKRAD